MEGIQVSLEKVGPQQNISVIKVGGYIDTTTSAELEHSLSSLLKSNDYNIIIDLGNVDYISSAGWGIFISEIKGIREKNGDLKLVRMIPDVYEVFELLEFHYILKAFDTIEEAIGDFEQHDDVDTYQTGIGSSANGAKPQVAAAAAPTEVSAVDERVRDDSRTIEEKLQEIIAEQPDCGAREFIKVLNTPRYGNVKMGWFQMRKYLKRLGLDTKKKRVEFFKRRTVG